MKTYRIGYVETRDGPVHTTDLPAQDETAARRAFLDRFGPPRMDCEILWVQRIDRTDH